MIEYLVDTNIFSDIFKGNAELKKYIEGLQACVGTTVYVECIQGSKGRDEKKIIKSYLSQFPLIYFTPKIARSTISLIETYSSSNGLLLPDAMIAAAAIRFDLTLITYNLKDFKYIKGLRSVNPKTASI